jgi:hypothetical protein
MAAGGSAEAAAVMAGKSLPNGSIASLFRGFDQSS